MLSQKILECYLSGVESGRDTQLIFSTHECNLLNLELIRICTRAHLSDADIDFSYARLFEGEDSYYISCFICYFSKNLSEEEELEEKEQEELLRLHEDRVYNHVEEWIDDLPYNALKLLRELVKKGRMEAPIGSGKKYKKC